MKQTFYICEHCGNMIEMIKPSGVPIMCCGKKMQEIIPGMVEASLEKHIPVYEVKEHHVLVTIGEITHPMTDEHFIEWISIQTKFGSQRKQLHQNQEPKACFCICDGDEVEAVYAYCNLHGLWKK